MAKFEKTDAYVCSGTAREAAAGIGPAKKSFGSRWISFATTRDPEETKLSMTLSSRRRAAASAQRARCARVWKGQAEGWRGGRRRRRQDRSV